MQPEIFHNVQLTVFLYFYQCSQKSSIMFSSRYLIFLPVQPEIFHNVQLTVSNIFLPVQPEIFHNVQLTVSIKFFAPKRAESVSKSCRPGSHAWYCSTHMTCFMAPLSGLMPPHIISAEDKILTNMIRISLSRLQITVYHSRAGSPAATLYTSIPTYLLMQSTMEQFNTVEHCWKNRLWYKF